MSKKAPESASDIFGDYVGLRKRLAAETDSGAALCGAALLDDCLAALLRATFIDDSSTSAKLLEWPGPVSTFSGRIDLAFCLGLVKEAEWTNLHTVQKIRNKFAHQRRPPSFRSDRIRDLCSNLQVPKGGEPRDRFVAAIVLCASQLLPRTKRAPRRSFTTNFPRGTSEADIRKLVEGMNAE